MIYIIGLGSTDEKGLSLEAYEQIKSSKRNFLRTDKHQSIKLFKDQEIPYKSFDYLYEEKNSFEEVYDEIVDILLKENQKADLNYCVPGDPFIAEKTVVKLLEKTSDYKIISGMSFIEAILRAVKIDPTKNFQLMDGDDFDPHKINTSADIIITQVYNKRISIDLKLALSEIYTDDYMIYLVTDAGLTSEDIYHIPIYELDRIENINHQSAIFIPKDKDNISLGKIIKKLEENTDLKEDFYMEENELDAMLNETSKYLKSIVKLNLEGYYSYKEILELIYENISKNQWFSYFTMENQDFLMYNCL